MRVTSVRSRSMSYAKINLRDVADSAAGTPVGEHQDARLPRVNVGAEQSGMNYLTIKPGKREAFAHKHEQAEELYLIVAGSGRVKLDDDVVELEPRDVLRAGPGTVRQFEADDDGLEVFVFGARVAGDGAIVEDFWVEG